MTNLKSVVKDAGPVTEALYLACFTCYVIFFYLQTTTFALRVPGALYAVLRGVLTAVVLFRLYTLRKGLPRGTAAAVAAFLGLGVFFLASRGDTMVLDAALFTAGAYGVSFKRIGMLYVFTGCFISLLALIFSQTGYIPDYQFNTNFGDKFTFRHSLGIIYPTDCFAHIFYLAVTYFLIRWKRVTYIEIAAAEAVFAVFYYLTRARADMIAGTAMLLIILILKITGFRELKIPAKVSKALAAVFMPVCAAVSVVTIMFYDETVPWLNNIDAKLSYRLSLGKVGMELYGFKLLGNSNFAENGNANGGVRDYAYVFYDSAYVKYLYKYGIILLLVLFVVYALIGSKMVKSGMQYGLLFIFLIASTYIIEHHMLELSYNITLLALTADISTILQSSHNINNKSNNGIITKTT